MVLFYSRKYILILCQRMGRLAWHHAHNEAFRRLGGIPAVLRIVNLKTGIVQGAGPWGQINPAYRRYAACVGFHIDACMPGCPEDKGEVESKVGAVRRRLRRPTRRWRRCRATATSTWRAGTGGASARRQAGPWR